MIRGIDEFVPAVNSKGIVHLRDANTGPVDSYECQSLILVGKKYFHSKRTYIYFVHWFVVKLD